MMQDQHGVVVVTGGAGGIGRAIVNALQQRGDRVAVLDREPDGLGDLAVDVDVTVERQVVDAVAAVETQLGPVDRLVCAAGVVDEHPLPELKADVWHRVVDVSLTGTYHAVRAVVPGMISRRRGAVVGFSSGYARTGYRLGGHYAAAKAGVEGFLKSVALETGPAGVRVNVVAPGPVMTPMIDHVPDMEAWRRDREARIPLRRIAEPADIVGPVGFLLDDRQSGYVTGQVLQVNGGLFLA